MFVLRMSMVIAALTNSTPKAMSFRLSIRSDMIPKYEKDRGGYPQDEHEGAHRYPGVPYRLQVELQDSVDKTVPEGDHRADGGNQKEGPR
jgi:hypothetical protein